MDEFFDTLHFSRDRFTYTLLLFKKNRELRIYCTYQLENISNQWFTDINTIPSSDIDKLWEIFTAFSENKLEKHITIVFPDKISSSIEDLKICITDSETEKEYEIVLHADFDFKLKKENLTDQATTIKYLLTHLEAHEQDLLEAHAELDELRKELRNKEEECYELRANVETNNIICEDLSRELACITEENRILALRNEEFANCIDYYKDIECTIPGTISLVRSKIHEASYGCSVMEENSEMGEHMLRSDTKFHPQPHNYLYTHEYYVAYCEWKTSDNPKIRFTSFHIRFYEYDVIKRAGVYIEPHPPDNVLRPKTLFRNFVDKYRSKTDIITQKHMSETMQNFTNNSRLRLLDSGLKDTEEPPDFHDTILSSDVTITLPDIGATNDQLIFRHDVRISGHTQKRQFTKKIDLHPENIKPLTFQDFYYSRTYWNRRDYGDVEWRYRYLQEYYTSFQYH